MSVISDIQLLEPGSLIEVFELDGTVVGGGFLRFHGYPETPSIWWQGLEYAPWPIQATGFERTGQQQPVPTISVGNVDGSITSICLAFDDMLGMKVTRRRTFAKYLDAVNFPGGVNASADPTQHMPDEIWYVERKASESRQMVQFELSSALNFASKQLPGRQIIANSCLWTTIGGYRGPYCGYAGPPVAQADDTPTSTMALDKCGGRVASCKLRFGATNPLPFGGAPGAGLVRS